MSGAAPAAVAQSRPGQSDTARLVSMVMFAVAGLYLLCLGAALALPAVVPVKLERQEDSLATAAALNLTVVAAFIGLGLWARVKPLPAALTGLIFYGLVVMADVAATHDIVKGIAGRLIILAMLIGAVVGAVQARNQRQSG